MKKSILVLSCGVLAAILTGCATKTRTIDMMGMWASESGQLAIGKVQVQAIPEGIDSSLIKYSEDNAWLAPSMKLHEISITLTGSNSVEHAEKIVGSICDAFVAATPTLAGVKYEGATYLDQMGKATEARKAIELGKQAVETAAAAAKKEIELKKLETANQAQSTSSTSSTSSATCADGSCEAK